MFKKIFSKIKAALPKKKLKRIKKYNTTQEVSFVDLAGNIIKLEIRVNGNENMLVLTDKKQQIEVILDQELSTLLTVLLQSYTMHNIFPDLDEE